MQAFQLKDHNLQGTRLTAPDPMALVRDQLAALQPAASAEVPSSSGARGAGELIIILLEYCSLTFLLHALHSFVR